MGIRGLSTYISSRSHLFLKNHQLHDCTVVIDGNNLLHYLYNTCPGLHPAFGGDYDRLFHYFKDVFTLLADCNIRAIVVFDGGLDLEGRKSETRWQRAKQKLGMALKVTCVKQGRIPVFPIMGKLTLVAALLELGIETIQTEYEADEEIALLARSMDCYVISNDSDFYALDVKLIPLDSLSLSITRLEDDVCVLDCQLFTLDFFVQRVGFSDKKIIPMLGTLLGNDYIKVSLFENLFSQIRMPKSQKKMTDQHRRLQALVEWLRGQSVEGALRKVLSYVRMEKRDRVENAIRQSLAAYSHDKETGFSCTAMKERVATKLVESGIPRAFTDNYVSGTIPAWVLEIRHNGTVPFHSQVESWSYPSTLKCAWRILRIIGLIVGEEDQRQTIQVITRVKHKLVRKDLNLDRTDFESEVPHISRIETMTRDDRKRLLVHVLLDPGFSMVKEIPEDLQLTFAVMVYWMRNCHSPLKTYHIDALLICLLVLSRIDPRIGRIRSQIKLANVMKAAEGKADEYLLAMKNLVKYFELEPKMRVHENLYDKDLVHCMGEFQAVLYYSNALNAVLDFPWNMPNPGEIFSGLFIYNLINEFKRNERMTLVGKIFGEQSSLLDLYRLLSDNLDQLGPSSIKDWQPHVVPRKPRKGKNKENIVVEDSDQEESTSDNDGAEDEEDVSLIGNRFALLRV